MTDDALDFVRDEHGHWTLNGRMLTDNVAPLEATAGDLAHLLEMAYQAGIREEGISRLNGVTKAIFEAVGRQPAKA